MKTAGAPVSWGVCKVPGWGYQVTPERALTEMKEIGLTATEFGPQGWLPLDAEARSKEVTKYDLDVVEAFFLAIMHDPKVDPISAVEKELDASEIVGGKHLILAADSGAEGYDSRPVLDEKGWETLFTNLDRIPAVCAKHNVITCLHPHWGTIVQNVDEVERVMDNSKVGLCLDTGHLACGGADVVASVSKYANRVDVVRAKNIHKEMTDKLLPGELKWGEGVRAGMFAPIGEGGMGFGAIVRKLSEVGSDGYWVLEQDIMIDDEPPTGGGPVIDVKKSLKALRASDK